MLIMIASDIHGSLAATKRLLVNFDLSNASWLVLLGDFLNHGPRNPQPEEYQPEQVALSLNNYSDRIIAVRGNCDSEVDQDLLNFPYNTSWHQILIEDRRRLFLTHGHKFSPKKLPPLASNDLFLYGHTHVPQAEEINGRFLLNPGSVSLPKGKLPASYGLLGDHFFQIVSLNERTILSQISTVHK